jgi:hypothetical protein
MRDPIGMLGLAFLVVSLFSGGGIGRLYLPRRRSLDDVLIKNIGASRSDVDIPAVDVWNACVAQDIDWMRDEA